MKVFNHPNNDDGKFVCPICNKSDDKPVVLIGIKGTKDPINNVIEARQYHLDCIELIETNIDGNIFIYQKI